MNSSTKSFVRIHGPINLEDSDSEDEEQMQIESILKKRTTRSSQRIKDTPQRTPKTEVKLSSLTITPNTVVTPHRSANKGKNSTFTPLSPIPTPKQQYDKLVTSSFIDHDEHTNYSRILNNRSPVVARNTKEATVGETYRRLYRDHRKENKKLLHQKSQLEIQFRRQKLDHQLLLAKKREDNMKEERRIPKEIEKQEKRIERKESKLQNLQTSQETNENYKEIVRINEKVKEEHKEIESVNEGIKVINNLMHYSIKEYDIDGVLLTNKFEGEVGEKFEELLKELKKAVSRLEDNM